MPFFKTVTVAGLGLATTILPALPAAQPAMATTVEVSDGEVGNAVAVSDVGRRGDSVVGTLVNRTTAEVRDIRLLIDMSFLWANEVKPGEDSPGRSSLLTVAGPLPPNGRLAFEFTSSPPLPERSDGHYAEPQVHVLGYQSISAAGSLPAR